MSHAWSCGPTLAMISAWSKSRLPTTVEGRWICHEPLKPQIGVVTNVGMDHYSVFGSVDAIAAEKGKLVSALPVNGTAVLNADDARVLAMQSRCAGRVVTYGLSPTAVLRADDVRADWPNRLSFTALYEDQSIRVETQLCGAFWTPSVLAAMAVGQIMGVPLAASADAIRKVPPVEGRMCPVTTADGVTFISDCWKAPQWTIPASLEFMGQAAAKRKIVVIGTISDYPGKAAAKHPRVARQAMEAADFVLFVGAYASKCLTARRHPHDQTLQAFVTVRQLSRFLRDFLQPGDLVLLKGSLKADHLEQLVAAWQGRRDDSDSVDRSYSHPKAGGYASPTGAFDGAGRRLVQRKSSWGWATPAGSSTIRPITLAGGSLICWRTNIRRSGLKKTALRLREWNVDNASYF